MIFCFTGTGNSLAVARNLASRLGEDIVMINHYTHPEVNAGESARVVWVFPIYSWGVPPVVLDFIDKVKITAGGGVPHFMVCTCGDDVGLAYVMWRRALARRGWRGVSAHSVAMPNTYVLLPGFDVDTAAVVREKLSAMPCRVERVAHAIKCCSNVDDVVKGSMAWIKSKVIYPLFVRFMMSPKPFHALSSCMGCGRCAANCPMGNIKMSSRRPMWNNHCALCLACYHSCPHHAVAYGKRTRDKGRWWNKA